MMKYYAKLTKQNDKNFLVEFPQLEGCLTEGETKERALQMAEEALNGWLSARCDREFAIPKPKKIVKKNHYAIPVDLQVSFAINLRQLRKKRKMSQTEVANKLGISQQAYAKLETPGKTNPSLSTIQKLKEALDLNVDLNLVS